MGDKKTIEIKHGVYWPDEELWIADEHHNFYMNLVRCLKCGGWFKEVYDDGKGGNICHRCTKE